MKTGIEKFKNVISDETCDLLIKHIEDNMDKTDDMKYVDDGLSLRSNNVICRQLVLEAHSELDNLVYKSIQKVAAMYAEKYRYFIAHGDTGYQLRKITGKTYEHIDNIYSEYEDRARITSVILGLNSDYEDGEFNFPEQNFSTTVKRGEAIVFPVYYLYPHYVDAPIGYRYTINTWITHNGL